MLFADFDGRVEIAFDELAGGKASADVVAVENVGEFAALEELAFEFGGGEGREFFCVGRRDV